MSKKLARPINLSGKPNRLLETLSRYRWGTKNLDKMDEPSKSTIRRAQQILQHTARPFCSGLLLRRCVSLFAAAMITSTIAQPARAFISDELSSIIWQVIDDFLQEDLNLNEWVKVIEDFLGSSCLSDQPVVFIVSPDAGDYCSRSGGSTGEIVRGAQGDMGVPNPNAVRGGIEAESANTSSDTTLDVFELNPVVHGVYSANNVDRDLTRIQIQTILGEKGQRLTKQQIDATQEVIEGIATDADDAQKLDVTQDVMKKQIKAFAQQSLILGQMRSDALQARQDAQFTNLNLTNMSRTLDEMGRSDRSSHSANAMFLIEISGLSQLQ